LPLDPGWHAVDGEPFTASISAGRLLALCAGVFPLLALLLLVTASIGEHYLPLPTDAAAALGGFIGLLVGGALLKLYDLRFGGRRELGRLVIVPSRRVFNSNS